MLMFLLKSALSFSECYLGIRFPLDFTDSVMRTCLADPSLCSLRPFRFWFLVDCFLVCGGSMLTVSWCG
jgi:hypothetical protein